MGLARCGAAKEGSLKCLSTRQRLILIDAHQKVDMHVFPFQA